jgi:glyoxylase-like metal-dependent hydrolase (beta-lactamase superfamily II)
MERIHVKGNTWCLKGRQLVPYYQLDESRCILMDAGRVGDREAIDRALQEAGLTPCGVILTHMHFDHLENVSYFKEKYGIPAAMPRGEAEICRNARSLKNHLYCFTPGILSETPRLQDLICSIERPIEFEEEELSFQGATFGIFHSPGHAPDHICIITPDNVGYVGDAILSGEDLDQAKVPFVFGMELDLETKARMKSMDCDLYIVAHCGIFSSISEIIDQNVERMLQQLETMRSLITRPMNFCECYEVINEALGQEVFHPVWALHLERYIRPYLDYLVDTNKVKLVIGKGSPTLAPME